VFVEAVQYLLVLCTTVEVRALADREKHTGMDRPAPSPTDA